MQSYTIRAMRESDIPQLEHGFSEQGWTPKPDIWKQYLLDQQEGRRQVFVAELDHQTAGYLTLLPKAEAGPFAGKGWPEITDFNVLVKYQRQGIGTALMEAAEQEAAHISSIVTLGVGLHSGYGAAQRLYIKRGYQPDGSGVWYQEQPAQPYAPCINDDSLILYLFKHLR